MLFKSAMVTQVSGSVGGMTGSHNAGGYYFRSRVIPVNPNTSFQQSIRGVMGQLTSRWISTLTAAQRQGWEDYAQQVTLTNPLGDQRNVSGLNQYIRSNLSRRQPSLPFVD
ncbi:MAG TPA: hypothetical protein VLV83_27270, partial [Acidobacteriota bacterium]|nr:hypothetical protein [Acidobacteriota bacterium]